MSKTIKDTFLAAWPQLFFARGPSQPGNYKGSQELSAFAADVAALPNHARALARAERRCNRSTKESAM
jgi:hypothetical protein